MCIPWKRLPALSARTRQLLTALIAVLGGVLSHLLLDIAPHYAWIVYLDWFKGVPYAWLLQEALFGGALAIIILAVCGKARSFVLLGIFGAIYPDIEKVLVFDFHAPDWMVLLDRHSRYLTNNTYGWPVWALIGLEVSLTVASLAGIVVMKRFLKSDSLQSGSAGASPSN